MKNIRIVIILVSIIAFTGCKNASNQTDETTEEVKTPVTITHISNAPISESISLNATSSYQVKNIVKASVTGYIEKSLIHIGDYVQAGKTIFAIITKEADALKNYSGKDSLMQFKSSLTIAATISGIITEVNKQQNDFVTEGDQLAVIAQQSSFVFMLNVPFELNKYAAIGTSCNVFLPDSTIIKGVISSKLSMVDAVAQTQSYIIKISSNTKLPENLLATVQLFKNTKPTAQVIEKSAVLSNETMESFWVMKLINDTTAVRVPVNKGIVTEDKIEILSPIFNESDRILNSGHYGLADTAFVSVGK
ncbi:MAG: HlyD family efflux transporter periplasmic adaptor subunit [Bacteroidia bacterium]